MDKNLLIIIVVIIVVISFIFIVNIQTTEKKIKDQNDLLKTQTLLNQQNRKDKRTEFLMNLFNK